VSRNPIEVYLTGHTWVAHRVDGHDCAAEPPAPHGTADTETGAVRALIRQEAQR
jgi:hypothetical protein